MASAIFSTAGCATWRRPSATSSAGTRRRRSGFSRDVFVCRSGFSRDGCYASPTKTGGASMRKVLWVLLLAVAANPALAKKVEIQQACAPPSPGAASPCQAAFDSIAKDLVATIDYKALQPAESTGVVGFGLGVVATYVPVDVKQDWKTATGTNFSGLGLVGIQVTKGLPLDIDLGAFYSPVPSTNWQ